MMRLAMNTANITGPEGSGLSWDKMMAEVRGTKLIVRRRSGEVLHSIEATAVRAQRDGTRFVETADGVYTIKRAGCGCGSRR